MSDDNILLHFPGEVVGKRFMPDDRAGFFAAFDREDAARVVVSVEREKRVRTTRQNRYLFGLVYKMIAKEIGFRGTEEIHELMKAKFNSEDRFVVVEKIGPDGKKRRRKKRVRVPMSTTALSTDQFHAYIEAVRQWAAEFLSMDIPDPVTAGY